MKLPFLPRQINAVSYMMLACSMTGAAFTIVALFYAIPNRDQVSWPLFLVVAATVPLYYAGAVWVQKRHEARAQNETLGRKDYSRGDRTKNGPTKRRNKRR